MPGTVLLLAASPVGKRSLVDAASVLPVLAAVAPAVLSGADTANVVELADPLEPQAVLTRLRAAATAPGPLTVFVTGQLQLDRRQRLPHLALARTTPSTVRYTGFPWHWIREELRLRAPGGTTVFVDLHADAETWQHLVTQPLAVGPGVRLYGRIAPPPPRRTLALPTYMKSVATILRSGHRPAPDQLHQQALTRVAGEEPDAARRDIVLAVESPAPAVPTPFATTAPAVPAAASWEAPAPFVPAGSRPEAPASFAPAAAPQEVPASAVPAAASWEAPAPFVPVGSRPEAPASLAPAASPPKVPAPFIPAASPPEAPVPSASSDPSDPHAEIASAVEAGRHGDADRLAARWEQDALRAYGPGADEVVHWMEVRADLAMFAGDAVRSCRTWLAVADARLGAGQSPDAPAVEAAADRAHHQWGRIAEAAPARELGASLAELRARVPGRREGALQHVHQRLEQLRATQQVG
ncbi:hypothetical protein [Streptomyces ureilyticus]|uniref:Uncharacterized protein n=1 Tax=Streptomyces ureilyticus TaxID=1775131 RepID=A0ABX0DYZ5_9ACTN|nr:hypothetical protein [Streptomyces ureilyticus]NGO46788.1 hypothetical protein [Streptomyces ureilyticus]